MQRRSINGLIGLGAALRFLVHCQASSHIADVGEDGSKLGIESVIDVFLEECADYDLSVTLRACDKLEQFKKSLKGDVLNKSAPELSKIMVAIEQTLRAESKGISSFFVTEKSIPIDKLTDSPEKLLPGTTHSEMPYIARYDFCESAMCLAFGRSTAAAFHILRATESVLREYYCGIVRKQDQLEQLTWGPMLTQLRKRTRRKPDDRILQALDYIVKNFRNPTAHPEKIYDIDEAYEVFNLCLGAIPRIMKDKLWRPPKHP